ncbi:MAG: hypothetical protein KDD58_02635 [Bdellovibrionales bacterium]|nr:hypothetical protein [Bdellovibrionales bacterium]
MVRKIFLIYLVLLQFLITSHAWAEEKHKTEIPPTFCNIILANKLLLNPEQGLGYRGFLGAVPEYNASNEEKMREIGAKWWGARIYIMPSLEVAEQFDNFSDNKDPLMKGFYLIDEDVLKYNSLKEQKKLSGSKVVKYIKGKLEQQINPLNIYRYLDERNEKKQKQLAQEAFKRSYSKKGMWYFEEGKAVRVPDEQVAELFTPENLKVMSSESKVKMPTHEDSSDYYGEYFLYQRGWFYTKIVGVITTERYIEKHKTGGRNSRYMKLRRSANPLVQKQGWRITFNKDLEGLIKLTEEQSRVGQDEDESNRFTKADYDNFRESFKKGDFITVEVWNGNGELVAGTYGSRSGNVFHPETLLYKDGIDKANFAILALMDKLYEAGITFLNTGMVTPNTENMGGEYLSRDEYEKLQAELPKKELPINFNEDWVPQPEWLKKLRGNP